MFKVFNSTQYSKQIYTKQEESLKKDASDNLAKQAAGIKTLVQNSSLDTTAAKTEKSFDETNVIRIDPKNTQKIIIIPSNQPNYIDINNESINSSTPRPLHIFICVGILFVIKTMLSISTNQIKENQTYPPDPNFSTAP